mgnify:FL=1
MLRNSQTIKELKYICYFKAQDFSLYSKTILMRKILFSVLALLILQTVQAQGRFGIKAGTNIFILNSKTLQPQDYDQPKLGTIAAVTYTQTLNKRFSLQAEFGYSFQHAQESYYDSKINLNYAQLPLLLQVHPEGTSTALYAGPQLNFLSGAKIKYKDGTERAGKSQFVQTDFGICWGIGTRPAFKGSSNNFTVDLRVFNGLANVFKST